MKTQDIRNIASAYMQVQEKAKMDPVNPDELKGTHAQRKDKDINNDGKVDGTDKYLHARRKAINTAMKKEEVEELDELSKKTLGSYVKKAAGNMAGNAAVGAAQASSSMKQSSPDVKRNIANRMKGIAKAHRNVKVTIIQADMQVNDVCDITTRSMSELVKFKRKGYGGTSHIPVFDYIKKKIKDCKLLISFTDGYSDINQISKPGYDVIWALTRDSNEKEIKWGKIVHVK
jgi:hypothetical protein